MKTLASLLFALFFLTACSTFEAPSPIGSSSFDAVATLEIDINADQAEIEALYNAKALSFKPEAGFAILGLSKEQAELSTLNTEENINALAAPEIEADGFSAWAGGWNAWAGGWNAWAGGWNAWAGGNKNVPKMPNENRKNLKLFALPQIHALSQHYGENVKVAVIDTGIQVSHQMFQNRLSNKRYDFIENKVSPGERGNKSDQAYGHGTAVAGIILQVAPKASIMPLRVLKPNGEGDIADVIKAIEYAVDHGADVINLSLGSKTRNISLETMISYATSQGVYVVASAGNRSGGALTYPAARAKGLSNEEYFLSVGSVKVNGQLSEFSSKGSNLEFTAPGEKVFSASPGDETAHNSGTSFAAPLVSGLLALAIGELGVNDTLRNETDLQALLKNTSYSDTDNPYDRIAPVRFMKALPNFQAKQALFVVNDSQGLSASDTAVRIRLTTLGYQTTFVDDNVVVAADAVGKDLILISATASPNQVSGKFRTADVPVIVWQSSLYDDMRFTQQEAGVSYGTGGFYTNIRFTDLTHPIGSNYENNLSFYKQTSKMPWGRPHSSATQIAVTDTAAAQPLIFVYEQGDQMFGMTAPARRVALPLHITGAEYLTGPGLRILDDAITWATSGN